MNSQLGVLLYLDVINVKRAPLEGTLCVADGLWAAKQKNNFDWKKAVDDFLVRLLDLYITSEQRFYKCQAVGIFKIKIGK